MAKKKPAAALPVATEAVATLAHETYTTLRTSGVFQQIDPARILVVSNQRKHFDAEALEELTASVRTSGILQPLIVAARLVVDLDDPTETFELVAGERRLRAAKAAGLALVPVMVRILTEQERWSTQFDENFQRQDLNPAEEAEALAEALARGVSVDELHHRTGKAASWIRQRAQLAQLIPPLLEHLRTGMLHVGAGLVLARLHTDHQWLAHEELLHSINNRQTVNYYAAEQLAQKFQRDLSKARFDVQDDTLNPERGACTTCPFNSACQQELFPDHGEIGRCLDAPCFEAKTATALERKKVELTAQLGHPILMLSGSWSAEDAAPDLVPYTAWNAVREETPGAVQAIIATGFNAGEVKWVRLAGTPSPDQEQREREKAQADRTRRVERVAAGWMLQEVAEELPRVRLQMLREKVVGQLADGSNLPKPVMQTWLVQAFDFREFQEKKATEWRAHVERTVADYDQDALIDLMLMHLLAMSLHQYFNDHTTILETARRLGLDVDATLRFADGLEAELPEADAAPAVVGEEAEGGADA